MRQRAIMFFRSQVTVDHMGVVNSRATANINPSDPRELVLVMEVQKKLTTGRYLVILQQSHLRRTREGGLLICNRHELFEYVVHCVQQTAMFKARLGKTDYEIWFRFRVFLVLDKARLVEKQPNFEDYFLLNKLDQIHKHVRQFEIADYSMRRK